MKHSCKNSLLFLLFFQALSGTSNAQRTFDELFYRLYITAGIYVGYSTGAAVGIGPKFSIGCYSFGYDRGDPDVFYLISNNLTAGYLHHYGTVLPCKELLFELQTVNIRVSDSFTRTICAGAGGGISLLWYQKNEMITDFYIRPRISTFAGNILFLNASKTFGLPKENGYSGLHIGGTAILGFPLWLLLWD